MSWSARETTMKRLQPPSQTAVRVTRRTTARGRAKRRAARGRRAGEDGAKAKAGARSRALPPPSTRPRLQPCCTPRMSPALSAIRTASHRPCAVTTNAHSAPHAQSDRRDRCSTIAQRCSRRMYREGRACCWWLVRQQHHNMSVLSTDYSTVHNGIYCGGGGGYSLGSAHCAVCLCHILTVGPSARVHLCTALSSAALAVRPRPGCVSVGVGICGYRSGEKSLRMEKHRGTDMEQM